MTVFVCPLKDVECGDRPENWCRTCPKRPKLGAPDGYAFTNPCAMRNVIVRDGRYIQKEVDLGPAPSNAEVKPS